MGRNKAFSRDQAVDSVMHLIWSQGYQNCSVKAVSEMLGITRSSFYHSFGSMESLFIEVLKRYYVHSPFCAFDQINEQGDILKEICTVFQNICVARVTDKEAKGCLMINSIIELVGSNDILSPPLSSSVDVVLTRLKRLLNAANMQEKLNEKEVEQKALALLNLLIGINVSGKFIKDYEQLWSSTRLSLQSLGVYNADYNMT
ncbi:TetR/AcrR family transcriptional regulator [Pseudoalteromonas luteoviolacea]|uniref:TetR/AcrR family transcriptional regulator n=1 Tax=Pseudoalteromonas luteoviolacea TaxID=43657 RepID=UPI001F2A0BE3|nr:TetR/AcrR family transcriptional regulator [Pseudoalteromonas luteoviolacea]MCF6440560.1 TetR/AcrR family transcriptional regulator [Pseudoalteromonas luteoviolacea]